MQQNAKAIRTDRVGLGPHSTISVAELHDLWVRATQGKRSAQERLRALVAIEPALAKRLASFSATSPQTKKTPFNPLSGRSAVELFHSRRQLKKLLAAAARDDLKALVSEYSRELRDVENALEEAKRYRPAERRSSSWIGTSGNGGWQTFLSGGLPSLGKRR